MKKKSNKKFFGNIFSFFERNAQIKKSVLKQNRRFGVDEAEIARRKKELRIVLWGITYTRLLSNAVRDYFRKKNKTFQDWFPRTSFNNAGVKIFIWVILTFVN